MRILIIAPYVGDLFGQERVIRDSSQLLRLRGHEVFVLAMASHGDLSYLDGVELVTELTNINTLTPRKKLQKKISQMVSYAETVRPDIIHFIDLFDARLTGALMEKYTSVYSAHSVAATCPSSTRLLGNSAICDKPSGYTCLARHLSYRCLKDNRGILRRTHAVKNHLSRARQLKRSDRVIAVSEYIREILIRDGWPKEKIEVVYNPVSLSPNPEKDASAPTKLLVCAARLNPLKGIDRLLKGLAEVKASEWQLWICGDGGERAALEQLTQTLNLSSRVRFFGNTSYAETRKIVASARALIQPNVGPESFGLSVAEALSMGIPVIATNVPALNEIVQHETNGVAYQPNVICVNRELNEYDHADAIIVLSEFAKQTFVQRGISQEKIHVFPLGVNTEVFKPAFREKISLPLEVVYFGTLSLRKGVHYLLEGTKHFDSSRVKVTLMGPVEESFRPILARYPHVQHVGAQPHAKLAELAAQKHLYVFPSLEDGFPNTLIQAMASGLVPVTTQQCGPAELIDEGVHGFFIPPRDAGAIRSKIEEILLNPNQLLEMRQRCIELAHDNSWEDYAVRLNKWVVDRFAEHTATTETLHPSTHPIDDVSTSRKGMELNG